MELNSHRILSTNTTENISRIEIKQNILTRSYYSGTRMISHYQMLLPKQLLYELLRALHGHNANHPGITKRSKKQGKSTC